MKKQYRSSLATDPRRGANALIVARRQRVSAACRNKVNALKDYVTKQLAGEYRSSLSPRLLKQAVHEADALAATTGFPGLFLPALAEEKARSLHAWSHRQERIRHQTMAFAT